MTPDPLTSLPEVLYAALQAKPCTRRDLERAAALKGYAAVQVEVALSRARKLGVFVQEPMYRLTEDGTVPADEPQEVPARPDPIMKPSRLSLGRKRSPLWQSVLERVRVLEPGDSCVFFGIYPDQLSDRLTKWRKEHLIAGQQYQRRTVKEDGSVTVTRLL